MKWHSFFPNVGQESLSQILGLLISDFKYFSRPRSETDLFNTVNAWKANHGTKWFIILVNKPYTHCVWLLNGAIIDI